MNLKTLHDEIIFFYFRKLTNNSSVVCPECGRNFANKSNLNKHRNTVHASNKPFPCDSCPKHFATEYQLQRHAETHIKDPKLPCEVCGKCFKTRSNLRSHMDAHTVGNPYACDLCGNSFSRKDRLSKHRRMLHPDSISSNNINDNFNLLSCTICKAIFRDKESLNNHKLSHTYENDKSNIKEEVNDKSDLVEVKLKEEPLEKSLS